jgi:hypothetical protein
MKFEMDHRDLQVLLEPIFSSQISLLVKIVKEEDFSDYDIAQPDSINVVVLLSPKKGSLQNLQSTVMECVEQQVKPKLCSENAWAEDVSLCWLTRDGKVLKNRDEKSKRKTRAMNEQSQKQEPIQEPEPIKKDNVFELLQDLQ